MDTLTHNLAVADDPTPWLPSPEELEDEDTRCEDAIEEAEKELKSTARALFDQRDYYDTLVRDFEKLAMNAQTLRKLRDLFETLGAVLDNADINTLDQAAQTFADTEGELSSVYLTLIKKEVAHVA